MARWGWVLVVAAAFVLAGCLVQPGGSVAGGSDRPLSNESTTGLTYPDDAPSTDPVGVERPEPTRALAGRAVQIDPRVVTDRQGQSVRLNDSKVVVVGVVNNANVSRNVSALVGRAISYWERNGERYVGYEVDFELDPDAPSPDVLVSFQRTVECQGEAGWLGCSPKVESMESLSETQKLAIKSGYTNRSTVRTIKHEVGHLLGIGHGEPPMPLMSPRQESIRRPEPSATEREFPWSERNLSVYVDYNGLAVDRRVDVAKQVSHALGYYEHRLENPRWRNVSFTSATSPGDADLVIEFNGRSPQLDDAGSVGRPMGPDVDDDGRVEYYTRSRIVVTNVRMDAIGWHVGYWLGVSLGATDETELPAPFRNGARTDDWWE